MYAAREKLVYILLADGRHGVSVGRRSKFALLLEPIRLAEQLFYLDFQVGGFKGVELSAHALYAHVVIVSGSREFEAYVAADLHRLFVFGDRRLPVGFGDGLFRALFRGEAFLVHRADLQVFYRLVDLDDFRHALEIREPVAAVDFILYVVRLAVEPVGGLGIAGLLRGARVFLEIRHKARKRLGLHVVQAGPQARQPVHRGPVRGSRSRLFYIDFLKPYRLAQLVHFRRGDDSGGSGLFKLRLELFGLFEQLGAFHRRVDVFGRSLYRLAGRHEREKVKEADYRGGGEDNEQCLDKLHHIGKVLPKGARKSNRYLAGFPFSTPNRGFSRAPPEGIWPRGSCRRFSIERLVKARNALRDGSQRLRRGYAEAPAILLYRDLVIPARAHDDGFVALAHIGEAARVHRGLVHRNPAYDGDARAPYEHGHPPAALARHAVAVPNRKQGYF